MGGQTPTQLAHGLAAAGVPLLGTPPDAIDLAEDRGQFGTVLEQCGLDAPPWGQATTVEQALAVAERVGYPGPGPPLLCARRPLHGGLLRRRRPGPLSALAGVGRARVDGRPGVGSQVSHTPTGRC